MNIRYASTAADARDTFGAHFLVTSRPNFDPDRQENEMGDREFILRCGGYFDPEIDNGGIYTIPLPSKRSSGSFLNTLVDTWRRLESTESADIPLQRNREGQFADVCRQSTNEKGYLEYHRKASNHLSNPSHFR
jgi:hypothetical protein